jgi:hypothetical protein
VGFVCLCLCCVALVCFCVMSCRIGSFEFDLTDVERRRQMWARISTVWTVSRGLVSSRLVFRVDLVPLALACQDCGNQ